MLLMMIFLACDSDEAPVDTGCRGESDGLITLYFDTETCEGVEYECAESSVMYQDACGCGCLLKEEE
jgi:hypothetical protein